MLTKFENAFDIREMTSVVQGNGQKKGRHSRSPGDEAALVW